MFALLSLLLVPTVVPAATPHPPCDAPLTWLAAHDRHALPVAYCAACAGTLDRDVCHTTADGEIAMAWDLLDHSPQRYSCNALEYGMRVLDGWHGQRVDVGPWAAIFAKQGWYRPQTTPRPLSKAAKRNRAWLQAEWVQCRAARRGVTAAARAAIAGWFAATPRHLPAKLFVDGKPATRKVFMQFLSGDGLYRFDHLTPVEPMPADMFVEHFPGQQISVVQVGNSAAGIDCIGMDACEGYEWSEFIFDAKGRIIGINLSAAG